ncbi:MAG: GNAT family N-acetyltransferase [Sandaracinaceae bacterium]
MPRSERLRYERLTSDALPTLLQLAQDAHIRRYLLDGELMDMAWCEASLSASEACFETHGAGLFLVFRDGADDAIGFAGFHVFNELGPEPQLLYALLEPHTGMGLATEIARALLELAREVGFSEVVSAVDAPNTASLRVLKKVGFQKTGELPGAFGATVMLVRRWAKE